MVYDHEEEPVNFHVISRAYSYDVSFLLDGTIYKIFDPGDTILDDFSFLETKVKEWLELDSYQSNRIKTFQGIFTNRDWISYLWEMNNENYV